MSVRRLFVQQDKGKVMNSGVYHSLLIACMISLVDGRGVG